MPNDSNTSTDQVGNRPGRLAGKIAVITGGAAGMGRTTSLMFANEGATVAILDIQKEAGEEVVALIRQNGGTAEFIATDVSDAVQVDAAFDQVIETFGPYNVLFNHAGTITVKATARIDRRRLRSVDGYQCALGLSRVPSRGKRDER